jgi:hypothetical protein
MCQFRKLLKAFESTEANLKKNVNFIGQQQV